MSYLDRRIKTILKRADELQSELDEKYGSYYDAPINEFRRMTHLYTIASELVAVRRHLVP